MTSHLRHHGASQTLTPLPPGLPMPAQPRSPANDRTLAQDAVPATRVLLLAWLLHLLALLAGPRRTGLPQILRAHLAAARSWHAQAWPAGADAEPEPDVDPRVLARILYVLGPPPCRGMRPHAPALRATLRRFTGARDRRPAAA